MAIQIEKTDRGFYRGEFEDRYGKKCSIQESSLATENALWLGCDEGVHVEGSCLARMHLTQKLVADLIPLLDHFLYEGNLPHPPEMYEAWVNVRVEVGDKVEIRELCLGEFTREDAINVLMVYAKKHFGEKSVWNGYQVEVTHIPEMRGYNGGFLQKVGDSKR